MWMGLTLLIPLAIVFLIKPGDESAYYYHPLLNFNDLSWLHFNRNYGIFFPIFFPIFLLVIYARNIHMDKKARLMNFFTISSNSKIKLWFTKYLFLQVLALAYILIYLCLPVFIYILVYDPTAIGISFFQTGLFLSLKSWLALSSISTIIFIIQILSGSFYIGLLLPMILYVWMFFLPSSPLILFVNSVHFMEELSRDSQPFLWALESFHWGIISLTLASILLILLVAVIYLMQHHLYIKRLFFGMAASMLVFTSCQNDQLQSGQFANGSNDSKDSLLIEWLDTVQMLDQQNNPVTLSNIIEKTKANVVCPPTSWGQAGLLEFPLHTMHESVS